MASRKSDLEYVASKGSVFLITSDGRTLSLPIPSQSPCDPLNWSTPKQICALCAMSAFTIVGLVLVQGTSLFLQDLALEYAGQELEIIRLDMLSSIPSLFWGIGALVWVPLSTAIGKRPVFLMCTLILTLSTLWAALSTSIYSHFGARCVQGFAGSISPSTMLLSLIDLTYIHQRPQYLAAFWCLCNALSNVGLAFTPFIIQAGGSWRTFYWVWIGPCAFTILLALFLSPETSFRRPAMALDGRILAQDPSDTLKMYSRWEEVPREEHFRVEWPTRGNYIATCRHFFCSDRSRTGGSIGVRTYFRELLFCALNPLIFWSLTLNALVFGSMIITCLTYVQVLLAPPYNFSPTAIGLAKFSTGIGAVLAYPISGPLTRRICRNLTARNRGVREPEHYLPSFVIPVLSCCTSLALYGASIQANWDWFFIIFFVGLNYFSAIALFTANTLWITESFPRGPALVLMGAGGYGISFALSGGITPWIHEEGFANAYFELSLVVAVVACAGFPIYLWGKRIREVIYSRWSCTSIV